MATWAHHNNMVSEARREKKIILHGVSFWCSKSSSNKATLLLGWSHRYKNSWPLRNIHISNDNGFLTFYVDVFFPLSLPRLLLDLTVFMSSMAGVLQETGTVYPSWAPAFIPGFLVGSVLLICLAFLCCHIMCLYFLISVL